MKNEFFTKPVEGSDRYVWVFTEGLEPFVCQKGLELICIEILFNSFPAK